MFVMSKLPSIWSLHLYAFGKNQATKYLWPDIDYISWDTKYSCSVDDISKWDLWKQFTCLEYLVLSEIRMVFYRKYFEVCSAACLALRGRENWALTSMGQSVIETQSTKYWRLQTQLLNKPLPSWGELRGAMPTFCKCSNENSVPCCILTHLTQLLRAHEHNHYTTRTNAWGRWVSSGRMSLNLSPFCNLPSSVHWRRLGSRAALNAGGRLTL